MKKAKRMIAMLIAMVMILGMAVTAFAAEGSGTTEGSTPTVTGMATDRGTIIVRGIENKSMSAVKAYPIALAEYNNNGSFSGYKMIDEEYNIDLTNPTEDQLNEIYTKVKVNKADFISVTYDSALDAYTAVNQKVGMYLIDVPATDATTYGRAVASIYYADGASGNMIVNGDVTMTTKISSSAAWVKKSVNVKVDKKIEDAAGNKSAGNTAKIGDVLNYVVEIDPVPKYDGANPKLEVKDTLSDGLEYQNNIEIYDEYNAKISKDKYIVNYDETNRILTVNFVKVEGTTKTYLLNDMAGQKITIKYSAKLTDKAALNNAGNGNNVELTYTRDSSTTGDEGTGTSKTHTYTFDIDGQTDGSITSNIINKLGEPVSGSTDPAPLKDAEFTLYTDAATTTKYENDVFKGTTKTDDNGQVKITGLPAGTYYLKETKAPGEYSLNTHVFKIVIDATIDSQTGLLTQWTITIDNNTTSTFNVTNEGTISSKTINGVDILNSKLSNLPSTGGIGTYIFTLVGIIIMAVSAGYFFVSRRKTAK